MMTSDLKALVSLAFFCRKFPLATAEDIRVHAETHYPGILNVPLIQNWIDERMVIRSAKTQRWN